MVVQYPKLSRIPQGDWNRAMIDPEYGVAFCDEFCDGLPANGTDLGLGGPWVKTETNGLGVIDSAEIGGVAKFSFDAVAEAALAALYTGSLDGTLVQKYDMYNGGGFIFEARVAIFDIGDDTALDINVGMASAYNADAGAIAQRMFFHLNGAALSILMETDDATNDSGFIDSTVDAVDDTYLILTIDARVPKDIKFYIDNVRVKGAAGTIFDMSDGDGLLSPMIHVEKSSNDTLADVRVDWVRVLQYCAD